MVFLILIGAALFSLVFRGFGGDQLIEEFFAGLRWTSHGIAHCYGDVPARLHSRLH